MPYLHLVLRIKSKWLYIESTETNQGSRCGRADSVLDSHTTGPGFKTRSGLTQDIKMDSCVFQCDVPHQWIA